MKKIIISAIVGAVILFAWGFLSWVALPVHFKSYLYTPAQDQLLQAFQDAGLEKGMYMVPSADNRTGGYSEYQKANMQMHKEREGMPFAQVIYYPQGMDHGPARMLSGFLLQLISAFCAALILAGASFKTTTFYSRWWLVMLVAVITSLQGPLMGLNWFGHPWHHVVGLVFDQFVSWALCGAWMAWYMGRSD
jgi:hypothetical protein